ncbi:MAG: TonB-dependent receptor [Cyclobacteriaceae bacterium]
MKKLRAFSTLLICLISATVVGQYRLSGTVTSQADSSIVKGCTIYLNDGIRSAVSNKQGDFLFKDLPAGNYTVHVMSDAFKYHKMALSIKDGNKEVPIILEPNQNLLEAVVINDQPNDFGFTRMRSIENAGIYEGKKSEVIIPEELVANLATNNARQIYARVAGLNIWENDGAGLQLSIGGRGLDPNRTSNFNVRQNGYDISADALGYPESYYTPPVESIGRIQIVRGAASLQYGTQFGGLINFRIKKPVADKKFELVARQTIGSFNFYNAFTSASGTVKKLSYYTFFQYKKGDGWRENSHFNNHTFYANVNYDVNEKTRLGIDFTQMDYLAQQPGGLSDDMFREDPRQSNRERNWFKVNWNLLALHADHKFSASGEFNFRLFGLSAYRHALGFRPNRVSTIDDGSDRDLVKGYFNNWGAEARYLQRYSLGKMPSALLLGSRYFSGLNESTQGLGSTGKEANFKYSGGDQFVTYDYQFPNQNTSVFLENILYVNDKLSITPGIRYENIYTTAEGFYGNVYRDLAGNTIEITKTEEQRSNGRQFVIAGLGISYKPMVQVDVYSNLSQNYRSITFSDMRISNPSSVIDPDMKDEKGYSFDVGIRSEQTKLVNYDVSFFYLNYNNRIGEVQFYDDYNRVLRRRSNIGRAVIHGVESYVESDLVRIISREQEDYTGVLFLNAAAIRSSYKTSEISGVRGNQVEFVPKINIKSGVKVGYKDLRLSFQYSYLSDQFSDASNASDGGVSGLVGVIPSYTIMDASVSYQFQKVKVEGSINNLGDRLYFTRRATGYPGPGILPSDGRSFYLTLQVKM